MIQLRAEVSRDSEANQCLATIGFRHSKTVTASQSGLGVRLASRKSGYAHAAFPCYRACMTASPRAALLRRPRVADPHPYLYRVSWRLLLPSLQRESETRIWRLC